MRYCGAAFRDDATFLASGREEARRLADEFGMDAETRILEIGCGPGRLAIGMIAEGCPIARYDGVDIDRAAIDWCRRYVTKQHPLFEFYRVDAQHARYNPEGKQMDDAFSLPFEAASHDMVYLHSVFANLLENDIKVYCREFHRLLLPGGQLLLTAFVEEGVASVSVNPTNYVVEISGPQHVVRFERSYFLRMLSEAGFEVKQFSHGTELGGQSFVRLVSLAPFE